MNTNKDYMAAVKHLDDVCQNANQEQIKFLRNILENNKDTEFGKQFQFEEILKSREADIYNEYISRLPISEFSNYSSYIDEIRDGRSNVLTKADTVSFAISSGTTSASKYIPIPEEDIRLQKFYENDVFKGLMMQETGLSEEELFGCVFQLNEIFQTRTNDKMLCVRSGAVDWFEENNGGKDISNFTASHEVFFPKKIEDLTYVKVRFALENPNVTGIQGVFAYSAISVFTFIENNWDMLLDDIENGTVNPKFFVPGDWKYYINSTFKPNPTRSKELRAISKENLAEGMLLKIWPKIKFIRVIFNDIYGLYKNDFEKYTKGLIHNCFAYSSSESNMSLALKSNGKDEYALIPDLCYFEFLPEDLIDVGDINQVKDKTLRLDQVQVGKKYEIIITTISGFYRYRLGDIIEIVDKYNNAPIITPCYRKNSTIAIAGENVYEKDVIKAIQEFIAIRNIRVKDYCLAGCFEGTVPAYRLFIETESWINHEDEIIFDSAISRNNVSYAAERIVHNLSCAKISIVEPNTFALYKESFQIGKVNQNQVKPIKILRNAKDLDFFLNHCIEMI